jgi:phospholipase C
VCGDLTSAFDFNASAHEVVLPKLPSTADFLERITRSKAGGTNSIPQTQSPTSQMQGQRPHRPLRYDLHMIAMVTPERHLRIEMINRGGVGTVISRAEASLVAQPVTGTADLVLRNDGAAIMVFTIALDEHYPTNGLRTRTVRVGPGTEAREHWPLAKSDHWYDLLVTLAGAPDFVRRVAGKVETGKPGRTDPGIGPMRTAIWCAAAGLYSPWATSREKT